MPAGDDGASARAREFERGSVALVADEVTAFAGGWVARTPSLPLVWSLNTLTLTGQIEPAAALELSERHLGGLLYRQLIVEDEVSGHRLEEQLRAEGWKVARNLTMALSRRPDRRVPTGIVIEPREDEALELMRRWTSEDETLRQAREAHHQIVEASRLTWRARSAQRLGVRDESGALAAMAAVCSDGVVAQVEDVYTVPEARGRGFARAVLTRAVDLAQAQDHDFVFIVADDDDSPKRLYAKLGFEPVGRARMFHR
jgi:ribosomal protein S18 acetylase RimI-like enzyme